MSLFGAGEGAGWRVDESGSRGPGRRGGKGKVAREGSRGRGRGEGVEVEGSRRG
jgi:hypothetical protein